jgi:phospholipid N-methyltransferase
MRLLITLTLFFITNISFSQELLKKKLLGSWIKTEITLIDGSKVFNQELNDMYHTLVFLNEDSILVNFNSKTQKMKYYLSDSILTYGVTRLMVNRVSDVKLELTQMGISAGKDAYKIIYEPKKLRDILYKPETYLAKNKALVYKQIPRAIEPSFIDDNYSPMDFIFSKFGFPEYKKGGFVVRFIITDKGKLTGLKVVASSNDKYNDKLLKAVLTTKNKWIAAEYLGSPINTEVEYNYNLGWEVETPKNVFAKTKADSLAESNYYYSYANDLFSEKSYAMALSYFTKSIESNPLNIDAYYQRAATYIFTKKPAKACLDYEQLMYMEQQKAKVLYEKYCKKKPDTN